ncbi:phage regulatory CII family protein [Aeromonas rivipollensis]|uniref:phage regulatory CII family protein n=1 Tax=Aeromonas rivipollensis TaxID=948519 RepID=UPI0038CFE060
MFEQTQSTQPHFASACSLFAASNDIPAIARAAGIGVQTLRNKLNPAQEHQLTAKDLAALYRVTGDDSLFDGLLFDCGLTAVRLPAAAPMAAETRAQQALNAGAQILGVTAQATTLLAGHRITRSHRNAVVGSLWAGIEYLVVIATEVENKFQAVPSLACAVDLAHAALGA